jgi:hypothetical protein
MGLIRDYLKEVGETWDSMAKGDFLPFMKPTRKGSPGTGPGSTGTGPGSTGSGTGSDLSERQRQTLSRLFHQHYGRYPQTEYEFQAWLRDNW